jgi:tRNA (cmo5U34)-methyltransferase
LSAQDKKKAEKMSDFFDVRAVSYDEHMHQNVDNFDEFYATVAKSIPYTKEEIHILDLGCGTGLELGKIFKRAPNAQITGIDLSGNMLAQLQKKYTKCLPQINLVQGSYLDMSFGDNRFDYVISVMTVHHLLKQKKLQLYKKIYQALKCGGIYVEADYIVTEEKERQILGTYIEIEDIQQGKTDGIYHLDVPMSIKTVHNLLSKAGFRSVKVTWHQMETAVLEAQV